MIYLSIITRITSYTIYYQVIKDTSNLVSPPRGLSCLMCSSSAASSWSCLYSGPSLQCILHPHSPLLLFICINLGTNLPVMNNLAVVVSVQQVVPWLLPKVRYINTRMYIALRFTFAIIHTNLTYYKQFEVVSLQK